MLEQPKFRSSNNILKKCRVPFIFDTVEDNVRSRVLFPFAIFLLYIILVFAILAPTLNTPEPVQQIERTMEFTSVYTLGASFSGRGPKPRARALTKDGEPVANTTMHAMLADIITDPSQPVPLCDGDTRTTYMGSLEYIRLEEVCRIVGFQVNSKTSDVGIGEFDMTIQRGPQGIYGVRFLVSSSGTKSEEDFIYLQSIVTSLYVDPTTYPPAFQTIGTAFTTQPKVRVLDQNGNPIAGKYVVAFSWPEPVFGGAPTTNLIQAYKYAYLTGDVSTISDQNGWANFVNLTIEGSTYGYANIFFVCEGKVVARWGPDVTPLVSDFKLPVFFQPIQLVTTVKNVTVVGSVSNTVQEGVPLAVQPTIRVADASGNPIANKMVIAMVVTAYDDVLPNGYIRNNASMTNKYLNKPIAGTYSVNFTDLFTENNYFVPIKTDATGRLKFRDLGFSVRGSIGKFQVAFISDGVYSDPITITVTTSVARVRIINQLAPYILLEQGENVQNDLSLIFQVVNDNEQGVPGKTATIQLFDPTGGFWAFSDFSMSVITDPKGYNPTDNNGIAQLLFSVDVARNPLSFARIAVTVDGLKTYSAEFRIEAKTQRRTCGIVRNVQFPTTPIVSGTAFQAKYLVLDEYGDPLANAQVNLFMNFAAWGPTTVPPAGFPLLTGGGSATQMLSVKTDDKGIASFDNVKITGGSFGHYYLVAVVKSAFNPDIAIVETQTTEDEPNDDTTADINLNAPLDNLDTGDLTPPSIPSPLDEPNSNFKFCQSVDQRFLFQSLVENFDITTPATTSFTDTPVSPGTLINIILRATNRRNRPIANQTLSVDITALQMPLYYGGRIDIKKVIQVKAGNVTNANGEIFVTLNVSAGTVGRFVFNFKTDGSFTAPYFLTAAFTPAKIYVNQAFEAMNGISAKVGEFLKPALVYVEDGSGAPVVGVTVIAVIDRTSADSQYQKVLHDIADYTQDTFTDVTSFRTTVTDNNGIANFSTTSVLDSRGTSCVRFNFFIGEATQYISNTSYGGSPVCFTNDMIVTLRDNSYSRAVAQDNPFPDPLAMTVQRRAITDSERKGVMMFVALPLKISDDVMYQPPNFQNIYFDWATCLYIKQSLHKKLKGKCNAKISPISKGDGISYNIEFTKLTWIQAARSVNFRLSMSTPLNYPLAYNKKNSSSYATFAEIMDGTGTVLNIETKYTLDQINNMEISTVPTTLNYPVFQNVTPDDPTSMQIAINTIMADWIDIPQAATSETIEVTNQPASIQIFIQPANTIYVGDPFQVTVKATISSGAPAARVYITAGMQASSDLIEDASSGMQLMFQLAQGKKKNNQMGSLNSKKNILLDPNTISARTNEKGIAYFTLRVIAAIPGTYTVGFEAGEIKSSPSDKFNLLNHIGSVDWVRNIGGTVEVTKGKMGTVFSSLPIQPTLQLKYSDYQTSVRKNIQIRVYKYTPNYITLAANKAQSYSAAASAPSAESSGGSDQLSTLFSVIGAGGMLVQSLKADEGLAYTFNYPEETADAQLIFSGIRLKFKKAGKFVVVFAIDGIESPPSDIITVREVKPTIGQQIADALDYVILVGIAIVVLLANSSYHDVWWLIVAILAIGAGYGFVIETDDDDPFYMTLLLITLTLMFFALLEIIYQLWRKKKDMKTRMTFLMRRDLSIEYAYQILNNRPSKRWLDYLDQNNYDYLLGKIAVNDEVEELDSDRLKAMSKMLIEKTVPKHLLKQMNKVNLSSSDNISSMLLPVNDELPQINQTVQPKMKTDVERKQGESQRQTQRDQSPNQAPSQSHSQHVDLKDEKDSMLPPKYLPNDKMIYGNEIRKHLKHDIRGPPPKQMGVLKAVFRSVYTNYKTPLVLKNNMILIIKIKDFFYYPQKIIAGVLIAGVSVAYIAYKVFMLIDSITTSIYNVGFSVRNAFANFMNNAMSSVKESGLDMSFGEDVFAKQQVIVDFVAQQFTDLSNGLRIAFNISAALSCILFFVTQIGLLANFRSRVDRKILFNLKVLSLRKGIYDNDYKGPNTLQIKFATQFIGFCIANAAFSWVLFTIVIGIAITPLTLPIFWKLIYDFLPVILPLLITPIIKAISLTIIKKIAIHPKLGVNSRRLWSLFEIYMFVLSIAAGVMTAIVRFIVLLVVSMFALIKMDKPLLAAWALEKKNGDPANVTYIATVYNHHQHNNPIMLTFMFLTVDLVYRHDGKYRNVHERKKKIISNRLHLWVLMAKQSHLKLSQYRKKNIPPKPADLKRIEKEKLADEGKKKNLCGKVVNMSDKEIQKRNAQKEKEKAKMLEMAKY